MKISKVSIFGTHDINQVKGKDHDGYRDLYFIVVWVLFIDHWGTILSKKEIDLLADGHRLIDEEKDVEYLDGSKSLIQYTRQ